MVSPHAHSHPFDSQAHTHTHLSQPMHSFLEATDLELVCAFSPFSPVDNMLPREEHVATNVGKLCREKRVLVRKDHRAHTVCGI